MKKWIFLLIVPVILVSCGKSDKGYSELEKALIAILEEKDPEYIEKHLISSAKAGNEDVYALAYVTYGKSGDLFFEYFFNKSKGNAEYYKGWLMKERGETESEIVNMFESSAKQGNVKAYYMLGMIFQDKLDFTKAQEYFKKGKDAGEIYSQYTYIYNKELTSEYRRVEELNAKYKENKITPEEKKEMGRLLLEKFFDYEKAYEVLKEFIQEEYPPALYTKAKLFLNEDKKDEATKILNEIFVKHKYYLASQEIAKILATENQNYDLALKVLEDTVSEEPIIYGMKGFIYQKLKQLDKAEENYLKSVNKNDVDMMYYLGELYEEKNELKKAADIYLKAYSMGSLIAGFRLAQVTEELEQSKLEEKGEIEMPEIKQSKEAKKILEKLALNGDDFSMVDLSNYYKEDDKMVRILNLRAATKLNTTAFYNLGVYYYNKKDKVKSRFYLRTAKENGYELPAELEAFLVS